MAPVLETSRDGGATWVGRGLARYDVREVLYLWVRDVNYGEAVVQVGDSCETVGFRSFTGGQFWERHDNVLMGATFLDPDRADVVHVQGADAATPCADAIDAASVGDSTLVLCADGRLYSWSANEWGELPAQRGALAILRDAPAAELLFNGTAACPTLLGAVTEEGAIERRACVPVPAIPGLTVGVREADSAWVWIGDFFGPA